MKGLIMFSSKKKIAALKVKIETLEAELRKISSDNLSLSLDNKRLKDQDEKEVRDANVVIDFNAVPIISLERYTDKYNIVVTAISYLIGGGVEKQEVKESIFYCSSEKHEELIKEFREHIKKHEKK